MTCGCRLEAEFPVQLPLLVQMDIRYGTRVTQKPCCYPKPYLMRYLTWLWAMRHVGSAPRHFEATPLWRGTCRDITTIRSFPADFVSIDRPPNLQGYPGTWNDRHHLATPPTPRASPTAPLVPQQFPNPAQHMPISICPFIERIAFRTAIPTITNQHANVKRKARLVPECEQL